MKNEAKESDYELLIGLIKEQFSKNPNRNIYCTTCNSMVPFIDVENHMKDNCAKCEGNPDADMMSKLHLHIVNARACTKCEFWKTDETAPLKWKRNYCDKDR